MTYENIVEGSFLSRPNRFTARVLLEGKETVVHVKNTGRCRELLLPGARVILSRAAAGTAAEASSGKAAGKPARKTARKTAYDLIGVYKDGKLFNIDSQAPNKVVREWLEGQGFDLIRPEYTFGESRVDFYMERGEERYLLEVKGCTLEIGGVGYFPDAPTERGVKHLRELTRAQKEGWHAAVAFVIQMEGVSEVRPNLATHPEFGEALTEAARAGVKILHLKTRVAPDSLVIDE